MKPRDIELSRVTQYPNIIDTNSDNKLFCISDSLGIRWIFPDTLKYPTFLSLYNSNTFKAYIYKTLFLLSFRLKLHRFLINCNMRGKLNQKYSQILKSLNCTNFSIFTGTPGENRKFIIEGNDGKNTLYFIKVPATPNAKKLVQNEAKILKELSKFKLTKIIVPEVAYQDNEVIAVTNIKPNKISTNKNFREIHAQALKEIYLHTAKFVSLEELNLISEIEYLLTFIKSNLLMKKEFVFSELLNKLEELFSLLNEGGKSINISLSHKDFTPWNMYITEDKLYVYDWELASFETPLLFDFFHYIFQQNILVKHRKYNFIKQLIEHKISTLPTLQDIIKSYNIEVNRYYGYYLLINTSYYTFKYLRQDKLHKQAFWLMKTWSEAIEDYLKTGGYPLEFKRKIY